MKTRQKKQPKPVKTVTPATPADDQKLIQEKREKLRNQCAAEIQQALDKYGCEIVALAEPVLRIRNA